MGPAGNHAPEQGIPAYRLVILFGIVAALGDVVYEGGRSVAGPFLLVLGASAFTVSFIAGFGEFVGYAIRIATGYLVDKTRQYRVFVIAGYLLIGAVPLLVLAGSWEIAACLLIAERIGKAVRSPAKDAMPHDLLRDLTVFRVRDLEVSAWQSVTCIYYSRQ